MPVFTRPDAEIYYEVHGSGFPLLLFAPGGLRSQLDYWRQSPSNPAAPPAWMNPMADLSSRFTVIGMDQRNAGDSRGAVTETHGWHTYAGDHLALMDHLGFRRFHVMGGCIGASYCLTLCELAPERITAAVLHNPISHPDNRDDFHHLVQTGPKGIRAERPENDAHTVNRLGDAMHGDGDMTSVTR